MANRRGLHRLDPQPLSITAVMSSVTFWAAVVVAVYAGILIHDSVMQWNHFNEGQDFGILDQGWYLVAHGHLDPYDTLSPRTASFLSDHGEFIIYLLAPLWWIFPSGLTLSILQDLWIAGGAAVAAAWVGGVARRRGLGRPTTAVAVALPLCFCLFNPWLYEVTYQDVHLEPLAVLLGLAAGRDLHLGHRYRAIVWIVLGLLCGDVAATVLLAVALTLVLAVRGARREGAVLAVVSTFWLIVLGAVHDNRGSVMGTYAYLTDYRHRSPSALQALAGLLSHPGTAFTHLRKVDRLIRRALAPNGFVSTFDPLVIIPVVGFVVINGLSSDQIFINPGFQDTPIYLFGALGAGMLVAHLGGGPRWRGLLLGAAAVALTAGVLVYDVPKLRAHANIQFNVNDAAAAQLAHVLSLTPGSAEVVSSFGTVGPFSQRNYVYTLPTLGLKTPVKAREVEFVFVPYTGNEPLPVAFFTEADAYLTGHLHARPLYVGSQVQAYIWRPSRLGGTVVLP